MFNVVQIRSLPYQFVLISSRVLLLKEMCNCCVEQAAGPCDCGALCQQSCLLGPLCRPQLKLQQLCDMFNLLFRKLPLAQDSESQHQQMAAAALGP